VKAQAYQNLQLVVLDDCSTDGSAEIIQSWLDRHWPDAIFVVHEINLGICRSVNDALSHAKGKYIRLLAADDRWIPNTLLPQVETMEKASEDVGVLYSDAFQIDEGGRFLPKMFIESHRSFAQMPDGWIFDTLVEGNFIPGMTALIRRSCFQVVGGADENLLFEDWDLWLRISRKFRFRSFPAPTACYRVVTTSMVRTMATAIVESEGRVLVKCLRRDWLKGPIREYAVLREYLEACRAYRRMQPDRALEAAWAFRHRICVKHALLLSFVIIGLPYSRFEQLIGVLSNIKNRAKLRANDESTREPR
ncbi:MAG: glycosyltransferase, partial [Terracidiphilus sp.]